MHRLKKYGLKKITGSGQTAQVKKNSVPGDRKLKKNSVC